VVLHQNTLLYCINFICADSDTVPCSTSLPYKSDHSRAFAIKKDEEVFHSPFGIHTPVSMLHVLIF